MSHIQNFWKNEAETKEETNARCSGCSACANKCPTSAINMRYDDEGFIYPVVDESICVACGLCEKVCIQTKKVFDACMQQSQLTDVVLDITNLIT